MKKLLFTACAAMFIAMIITTIAHATLFTEVEPNNTFATAQLLGSHDGIIDLSGSRVGNSSADYYSFFTTSGDTINMYVNTPGGPSYTNDPVLGLYSPSGVQLVVDDDSGLGYDSYLAYSIPTSGFYAAAVSGYSDFSFVGGGSSGWTYQLLINNLTPYNANIIPEPTSLSLLGLGLLGLLGIRKKKLI